MAVAGVLDFLDVLPGQPIDPRPVCAEDLPLRCGLDRIAPSRSSDPLCTDRLQPLNKLKITPERVDYSALFIQGLNCHGVYSSTE
jgi:hypothetical protein